MPDDPLALEPRYGLDLQPDFTDHISAISVLFYNRIQFPTIKKVKSKILDCEYFKKKKKTRKLMKSFHFLIWNIPSKRPSIFRTLNDSF